VTIVESALVLLVFLILLFGMLETSVALVRYNVVCESARRIARAAIVHGENASPTQGIWGPTTISINAGSTHPAAAQARCVLMTVDPADVEIQIEWPDGKNGVDKRVRVTVSYLHVPIVRIPGWYDQIDLRAVSTMRIAH